MNHISGFILKRRRSAAQQTVGDNNRRVLNCESRGFSFSVSDEALNDIYPETQGHRNKSKIFKSRSSVRCSSDRPGETTAWG